MAFDAFLKLEGLDGESTRKGFEKQMEIHELQSRESKPDYSGKRVPGVPRRESRR